MKIVSWNVNGIAACIRKGLAKFLDDVRPDILCCQEIKTKYPLKIPGYLQYWNPARRSGYSGTLTLARREPLTCQLGMGIEELDSEGRLIVLEYEDYYVLNVYVPSLNTYSSPDRVEFREKWDRAFRDFAFKLPKPVIMAGDFNVVRDFRRRRVTLKSCFPAGSWMLFEYYTQVGKELILGGDRKTMIGP